jgi:NDP-sugar pyrophosphorylase family protein
MYFTTNVYPAPFYIFLFKYKKKCTFAKQSSTTMQAFILAAGLGTRLQPLTDQRPKALVEIGGMPLLQIAINNLVQQGVRRIVINVHHFADMVCDFIATHKWPVEIVISDERESLLDTGGGLKNAETLFAPHESIIVHNVDILSHLDFHELTEHHRKAGNLATLAVCQRSTSRYLLFNPNGQLSGWTNRKTGETLWTNGPLEGCEALAFSGISVIEPSMLGLLPPADHPYPIIPQYLEIAKHHRISYFMHSADSWIDVGTPEKLNSAQKWNLSSQK